MAADSAGSVAVEIIGDYSSLTADFAQAEQLAKLGGEEISKAFASGAGAVDEFGAKVNNLNNNLTETPPHVRDAEAAFERLFERMAEAFAIEEVASKLKEIVLTSLEVSDRLDRVTIALTAMTGSAEVASREIEDLEKIANADAIAMPQLLTAAQRMAAFGLSMEDTNRVLQLAADAAAGTGNAFETVVQRLGLMAEEGTVGSKALGTLGINIQDLAVAMDVGADKAKKMFAALDQADRITALEEAMKKFSGQAEKVADTAGGEWQKFQNKIEGAEAAFGQMLTSSGFIIAGVRRNVAETLDDLYRSLTGELSLEQEATIASVAHANAIKGEAEAHAEAVRLLQAHVKSLQDEAAAEERAKEAAKLAKEEQDHLNATMKEFLVREKIHDITDWSDALDKNTKLIDKMNASLHEVPLNMFQELNVGLNPLNDGLEEANALAVKLQQNFNAFGVQGTDAWKQTDQAASDAINHMQIAAKTLGITLSDTYKKQADDAMKAFLTIAADGSSSANDITRAWHAAQVAMQADTVKTATAWTKTVDQIKNGIERDLSRALSDLIFHVTSVGDAFKKLGQDVVSTLLDYVIKQGIEALITKLFVTKATTAALNVDTVISYAAVAAAAAFAATAAIPIVGPELAPAAAALAYASTMAFAPLAAFDKGGYVPEDMIAMVHKGEYVVTAAEMSGSAPLSNPVAGFGGSMTIHIHADRNPEATAREIARMLKTKSPKFSPAS